MRCIEEDCNGIVDKVTPRQLQMGCPYENVAFACEKCGALYWIDNSRVIDKKNNMVFFMKGKLYSKNKKGETKLIQIA
ncbi:MAG: hypothetical protein NTU58_02215 [Candidatus Nealsonbacteria bacterium]|nr:hypothetical protein [Candidatus Nealsonbacteria bacterium]